MNITFRRCTLGGAPRWAPLRCPRFAAANGRVESGFNNCCQPDGWLSAFWRKRTAEDLSRKNQMPPQIRQPLATAGPASAGLAPINVASVGIIAASSAAAQAGINVNGRGRGLVLASSFLAVLVLLTLRELPAAAVGATS